MKGSTGMIKTGRAAGSMGMSAGTIRPIRRAVTVLFLFFVVFCVAAYGKTTTVKGKGYIQTTNGNKVKFVVTQSGDKTGRKDKAAIDRINKKIRTNPSIKPTIVFSKNATYYVDCTIMLYDKTTVYAKGATIRQVTPGKPIFINAYYKDSKYNKGAMKKVGGYNRAKDITVNGGTYIVTGKPAKDAKKGKFGAYKAGYSNFMFMHGQNIVIKNCTITNNYNGHFIEFAGVKDGTIRNVTMNGKYIGDYTNEAIQLDTCMNSSVSPQGAPWDGTSNRNITIKKCTISVSGMPVGIGHNSVAKKKSQNISILKNTIHAKKIGITMPNCKSVTYMGNKVVKN